MEINFEHGGYNFSSEESSERGYSIIKICKDGEIIHEFDWPTYKIFNLEAHAEDIVDGLCKGNDDGLYISGSYGLGGGCYNAKNT